MTTTAPAPPSTPSSSPSPPSRIDWVSWLLWAVMVGVSAVAWTKVPDRMPVHWNWQGEVDTFASRDFALMLLPLTAAGLMGVFWLVRSGLPVRESPRVSRAVRTISRGVLGLLAMLHVAIILAALGGSVTVPRVALGGASLLVVLVGLTMRTLPPNRLVGIRVPATLSDRNVWKRTHRLAASLLVGVGGLTLAASLLPVAIQTGVLLLGLLAVAVVLVGFAARLTGEGR